MRDVTGPLEALAQVDEGKVSWCRRVPAPALISLITALVVSADQLTQLWATSTFQPGARHALIGTVLGLQVTYNAGAAFSSPC